MDNILASAFWTLENGRGLIRSWADMAYMLEPITEALKDKDETKDFYSYSEPFVYCEENEDKYNGYGGLIRKDDNTIFNIDLLTYSPKNRDYLRQATQNALTEIKIQNDTKKERIEFPLANLQDMPLKYGHPMLMNDLTVVEPEPGEKLGRGW